MNNIKNILRVVVSNSLNFGSSFIVGFILPGILSVSDYGYYKQFTLIFSFVHVFSFGFNDGIYVKYGGLDVDEVNKNDVNKEHNFLIIFQILLLFISLGISLYFQNIMYALFSISIFIVSLTTFHQNIFQAIGDFKAFSMGNTIRIIVYLLLLILQIFILQVTNYINYIFIIIFSYLIMLLYLERLFNRKFTYIAKFDLAGISTIFNSGFYILAGNMLIMFISNIGNIIVNLSFSIEDFAIYSFQNSVITVALLIVNAIGIVFYNLIAKSIDENKLNLLKSIVLYLGMGSGLLFYVFKFIVTWLLPQYYESLSLLSITFTSIPFIMIVKIIIVNIYKTNNIERLYFKDTLILSGISFMVIYLMSFVIKSMELITLSTTLTYLFWTIFVGRKRFKFLEFSIKEIVLIISYMFVYLISSNLSNTIYGIIIYVFFLIIVSLLNFDLIIYIFNYIKT